MKSLAKSQVCVLIRGDVELWIDSDRQPQLHEALADKNKKFLTINGQTVNANEIIGVFTSEYIEERTRRKNGQWKCQKNHWHDRGKQCECIEYTQTVEAYVDGVGKITYKK